MSKKLVTSYTFTAASKTVQSADFTSLEKILLITNVKSGVNVPIYSFADPTKGASLAGTTLTLAYDTTGMSNSDPLQIFVEDAAATVAVVGGLTHNNAAPGANNVGVLSALANATAPTFTEGDQVLLSTNLSGDMRVQIHDGSTAISGSTPADGAGSTTALNVINYPRIFNGTNFDRARSIINATNSTGTGIAAAGILAQFDDTSPTTITENQFGNLRMSNNRNLYGTIRDAAGNERGVNVTAGNALQSDLTTIAGNAVSTAASGVQKIGIVGNANATLDSTVGAGTAPTNALMTGQIFNSTAPAPTTGQAMAQQADQAGNSRVFNGIALAALSAWNSGTALNATQNIFTNSGASAVLVHLVQTTTLTAGAITFEVTYDNSNWVTVPAQNVLDPATTGYPQLAVPYTVQASTNKPFLIVMNGAQGLRIKLSTQITGTGAVTPNYALLSYSPVITGRNLVMDAAGNNRGVNVTSGNALQTDLTSIAGTAAAVNNGTASAGAQRTTTASDNSAIANWGHGATGSAVPSGAQYHGLLGKTALPTAGSDGNLTGAMGDKFGRQVVLPTTTRDLIGTQTTTISASTSETTIVTAAASTFNDLLMLIVSNTSASTTTRIDFRDTTGGSVLFSLFSPAADTRGFNIGSVAIPQTTVNTNWTAQCATSTTDVRIYAVYAKNK